MSSGGGGRGEGKGKGRHEDGRGEKTKKKTKAKKKKGEKGDKCTKCTTLFPIMYKMKDMLKTLHPQCDQYRVSYRRFCRNLRRLVNLMLPL